MHISLHAFAKPCWWLMALIGLLSALMLPAGPVWSAAGSLETAAVMAPLDMDVNNPAEMQAFEDQLAEAKAIGVDTVSVDVWWGKAERNGDQQFDWTYYDQVFDKIRQAGLKIVPILSFHKCGGGPGDDCNIPLPHWLWSAFTGDGLSESDLKYESETGNIQDDAIVPWATANPVVLAEYRELMQEFSAHFAPIAGSFVEINISLGPTGELRYPAYNGTDGWKFPNRGNFQAYSDLAQEGFRDWALASFGDLDGVATRWGTPLSDRNEIRVPGGELPDHSGLRAQIFVNDNDHVDAQYGRDFIDWYNQSLVDHGRRLLLAADETLVGAMEGIPLGAKLPGINWQMMSCGPDPRPRIAEITVGLVRTSLDLSERSDAYGYAPIMDMLADVKQQIGRDLILHFTAAEMDNDAVCGEGGSQAKTLVFWISQAAQDRKITHKSENALACVDTPGDDRSWDHIRNVFTHAPYKGFTLLRLTHTGCNPWGVDKAQYQGFIRDFPPPPPPSTWYFRGTPNDWGTTAMTRVAGTNRFETCRTFAGKPDPRFKICHDPNWRECYPPEDHGVTDGTYLIGFDTDSMQISVDPRDANCGPPADTWYFRGTPNNWDVSEMERVGDSNVFRTCQTFTGVPKPRFKICRDKDWRECYPPEDHPAGDGTHEIGFDANTHHITLSDGTTCGSTDSWTFRGTPNGWGTTPMEQVDDSDLFRITVDFTRQEPTPRFKIDHFGDWTESYPGQDLQVPEDCSRYEITFDRTTKEIGTKRIGPVTGSLCATDAINIGVTPPAGSYPTAQAITLVTEPPGATLYYTMDGSDPIEQSRRYTGEPIAAPDQGPGVDLHLRVLAKADGLNDGREDFEYRIGEAASPGQVVVSRFWHNHQPIYWPEWNSNGPQTNRVQFAWDSITLKPGQTYDTGVGHPDNDLVEIFGKDDRRFAYQGRPRDSLAAIATDGGFAMSYSGSLIDNVRNLADNGQLGYGSGWWDANREAKGWKTPSGSPRLDLVGFTYHHSLGAVLPKSVLRKEIQIFKQAWWKAWGGKADLSDHSRGFFPTEMAFSTPMIDVLADEGYQWVIVASHHLSRTCPTYLDRFDLAGSDYGIKSSPPNKADLLGPSPTTGWWFGEPNPGNAAWNVSPFAYQLHRAKYVNPENGEEKSIILVPSDDVMSYGYGYADEGISKIQDKIAPFATDPSHPALVMPATDGDNAWGGGYDSWMVATPKLFSESSNAGYGITTVQDLVEKTPPPAGETVHVEDGAWIFPESGYGSPYFLKWVEPPLKLGSPTAYPGTMVDLETPGFALKFWSWAPLITGANWCETAEQIWRAEGGTVEPWKIQAPHDPAANPNAIELAWHIYLAGLDSGFNYYGGLGNDDEVKPSLATARAIEKLEDYVKARLDQDRTPPSIFKPQRFPWNPGGYTFGWFNSTPEDGRYLKKMPSELYVWTHVYDVSGVSDVSLKVRLDADGVNAQSSNQNETYAGGSEVGPWLTIPMTKRSLPRTRDELNAAANNGQIDYFITSPELADYYFAKITDEQVSGFRGKLVDYYIEATDSRGNTSKSDIQHLFVEDDGAAPAQPPT
jgi:hypothetical protein